MIRTPARFIVRALLAVLICTGVMVAVGVVAPAGAGAYATLEGPPTPSSAPGLPDGRVYEQVSPADKNGNQAGAGTAPFKTGAKNRYGLASPDGDSVLFEGTGPMGESPWADSLWFVATKNSGASGWATRALVPRATREEDLLEGGKSLTYIDPSQDLSHSMVEHSAGDLAPQANENCSNQLYLVGSDPFVAATWLERPSPGLVSPVENCQRDGLSGAPVGGTPDFSTVYFTYPGTLLPEDASRASHASYSGEVPVEAWGFYEYTDGVLHEAGVLPDGSLSAFGAVPAASGHGRNRSGNQVSVDGSRAFFVSPDPGSCTYNRGQNNCTVDPPQLYVRENGAKTVLVSQDTLLPPVEGPASAPSGVLQMPNPTSQHLPGGLDGSYVFASPDGSQAFFQSRDALTRPAEEVSPGSEAKTYDFDVDTGALTYLPGVGGEILATASGGSELAFMRPAAGGSPAELDLWAAGADGGSVVPITQLPEFPSVPEVSISSDGSVLVFQTAATIPGFNDRGSHQEPGGPEFLSGSEEIYRYDIAANTLGCVSCAPAGITPRGDASMSMLQVDEVGVGFYENDFPSLDEDTVSADGSRIFFESPDPLVPQDSNTNSPAVLVNEDATASQGRDVYEWENGVVYLISTGESNRDSYLLDSSENGDDVFFATTQGLVSGDTDGGYDVYDARVPRPGILRRQQLCRARARSARALRTCPRRWLRPQARRSPVSVTRRLK